MGKEERKTETGSKWVTGNQMREGIYTTLVDIRGGKYVDVDKKEEQKQDQNEKENLIVFVAHWLRAKATKEDFESK